MDEKQGLERLRAVKREDIPEGQGVFVHASARNLAPISWPSVLKWRFKIKTYSDGSAMGHVRPNHPILTLWDRRRSAARRTGR